MHHETPLEARARLLERQRNNELALNQKVTQQKEAQKLLKEQSSAHLASEETLKRHALMQSIRIEELNSIIQRQKREIEALKGDNSQVTPFKQTPPFETA